jgi:uncharacterized coiled-coil protein SlyX
MSKVALDASRVVELKQRLAEAQEYIEKLEKYATHLESKLEAFKTGNVPENATLDHMLLAKYGRIRLNERAKTAVLLSEKQQG